MFYHEWQEWEELQKAADKFVRCENDVLSLFVIVQTTQEDAWSRYDQMPWAIVHFFATCPDCLITRRGRTGRGTILRAEFEYKASNFRAHKHDPEDADLIICWKNDWKRAPVPVWELRDCLPFVRAAFLWGRGTE